ncbi:MAG TPA: hypothetical protein VGI40_00410 [Pirellulaceae bacterium]
MKTLSPFRAAARISGEVTQGGGFGGTMTLPGFVPTPSCVSRQPLLRL